MVHVLAEKNNDCGRKNGERIDSSPGLLRLHGACRVGGWVLDKCRYRWEQGGKASQGWGGGGVPGEKGIARCPPTPSQGGDGYLGRGRWAGGELRPPAAAQWKSSYAFKAWPWD